MRCPPSKRIPVSVLAFALLFPACGPPRPSLPSDAELLARFPAARPSLEQLEAVFKSDRDPLLEHARRTRGPDATQVSIGSRKVVPPPLDPASTGLSDERLALYRQLMAASGVQFIAQAPMGDEGCLVFLTAASGDGRKAQQKGYAHCPSPPRPGTNDSGVHVRDSLEGISPKNYVCDYRPIDGGWYLHLQGGD